MSGPFSCRSPHQGTSFATLAAVSLLALLGSVAGAAASDANDAKSGAGRIRIDNFGRVNEHLYRGAQPDEKQYVALAELGVKTVIDLRDDARSWARQIAERSGIRYVNLKLSAVVPPTREESAHFLRLVEDEANWPVFVHCAGGRHRTGVLIALYRMVVDHWTADRAYEEMKQYKFYSAFGHGRMKDFVFDVYRTLIGSPAADWTSPAIGTAGGGQQD